MWIAMWITMWIAIFLCCRGYHGQQYGFQMQIEKQKIYNFLNWIFWSQFEITQRRDNLYINWTIILKSTERHFMKNLEIPETLCVYVTADSKVVITETFSSVIYLFKEMRFGPKFSDLLIEGLWISLLFLGTHRVPSGHPRRRALQTGGAYFNCLKYFFLCFKKLFLSIMIFPQQRKQKHMTYYIIPI